MLRPGEKLGLALLLAVACTVPTSECIAQTPQPPLAVEHSSARPVSATTHKSKARAKKPEPLVEVPQTPPPPPTLEQQPPSPPQVTYKNGQLTIDSRNATLSQVLHSVQAQTGASIDIPPGAGSERVVATLGPGQPKDVLASLLNGSKFNYVILGEADNPGAVQKVILTASTGAGGLVGPSVATTSPNTPLTPQPPQAVDPPDDEYQQANEAEVENQNQLTPGQPMQPGSENLTPDVVNPAGRTPEQMLQELQRMQQQQQQMQQQLNPANQQPQQAPPPGMPLVVRPQPQ
jgi:hypothetical protein